MSELISGKEALIALASGECVEYRNANGWTKLTNMSVNLILNDNFTFRRKPRTITLNGIEIPAPFEPKEGDLCFVLDSDEENGFYEITFCENFGNHRDLIQFGAWRTEEEIKQVVAALREVFK